MKQQIKVLSIFGTRPEAIKMAPVIKVLQEKAATIINKVVVTAQHREMLDQVLQVFNLVPDYDLSVMRQGQDLFDVTTKVLSGLKEILIKEKPELVMVQGDTTTTFAGALAAFYLQIPVGHVEAGLRTYQRYAPFPEEINRVLTTHLADLHFAPTATAKEALLKEGIAREKIYITGNPVIDALHLALEHPFKLEGELARAFAENRRAILLTTHRRENLGDPLDQIYLALRELLERYPDLGVIFPVHKNPQVRREVNKVLAGVKRVYLTEPLEYLPFINVMKRVVLVLTDSGGVQEEAPALGKPVLVLREFTERPEAVAAGTAMLVGTERERIVAAVGRLLDNSSAYRRMAEAVNPYGDGKAAERIVAAILHHFQAGPEPEDFHPEKNRIKIT